jgi:RNA polymerase sigma-70 factor, ECF subfamily
MLACQLTRVATDFSKLIDEHYATASAAWPTFKVPRERFHAHVLRRVHARASEPAEQVIRSLPAADVYLAAACSDGDAAAITAFRDTLVPTLRPVLGKLAMSPAQIDETIQRVLVLVFVGEGGPRQIDTYGGRGTLRSWLRTIAVRTGRRMLGLESDIAADEELSALPAAVADPELELLRGRYRDQVREAFGAAFSELSERDRNVLRQYHIDGLTIDQLAGLYQVNRATTARWVAGARLSVVTKTRNLLVARFGLDVAEVDSIIRLVRSQLDVSVREIAMNPTR